MLRHEAADVLQVPAQATQDEVSKASEREREVLRAREHRFRGDDVFSLSSQTSRPRPLFPQNLYNQIRRAYLAAARKAHPDLGGSASEFKRVAAAYAALSGRGLGLTFPPSSSAYYHYHHASSASAAASLRPPRASFSNVTLALVLSVPLALAGVAAAHANAHGGVASGSRPHGLLSPPVNEFLSEERHATVAPSRMRLSTTFRELWGRGWQWGR